ncbi:MAG: aminopeptidase P family protein [Bacteriovoracaceae bacterium]|nr:aminopeptidase P family protein [Bacteriovoracaceae bacterium]
MSAENVGEKFNLEDYLKAREISKEITLELAHSLPPGSTEEEAHELLKTILARQGITKLWHPSKIRFGENTLCTFREESTPGQRLGMGDLFFVDIGPVFNLHEGDYGETFRCGGGSDPLIAASTDVFRETEKVWREQKLSGPKLYEFAQKSAQARGYKLDLRSGGHRCGDFPHALFHKGKLLDFSSVPTKGVWILEIHLRDEERNRGAFFEDILGLEDLKS